MKSGSFLLEFMTYLVIAAMLIGAMSVFMVRVLALNTRLEKALHSESDVHNALTIFHRDADSMPRTIAGYLALQHDRITFKSAKTAESQTISWYVDHARLIRACYQDQGWEHAVVLEPVERVVFTPVIHDQRVRALKLSLTHNRKNFPHTVWLIE